MITHLKRKNKIIIVAVILILIVAGVLWLVLSKKQTADLPIDSTPYVDANGKITVVASLFPVYDFAKIVGGDKANVVLILPPGAEAHGFRPQAKDLELIKKSGIFFYVSALMEPWAPPIKAEVGPKTHVFAVAEGLNSDPQDPHVWMDFSKASLMVETIAKSYQELDPANASYYEANAKSYEQKLNNLDQEFTAGLANCKYQEFISGGHHTFAYLANRYHLKYQSALGYLPGLNYDTDTIINLGKELKSSGEPYVYYEEMIMPHFAEILRQESGANLMPLNAAHNVGRYDIESGISFLSLMEGDLVILKKGLLCQG
jgi:zinc transport system substrate-binding protein